MNADDQPAASVALRPDTTVDAPSSAAPRASSSRALPLAEAARRVGGDPGIWRAASRLLPVRWPAAYMDLATGPGGAPIRAMGVPHQDELAPQVGELVDPVGEASRHEAPFVVRKHADRAILLVTAACHFYCRFCFRRSFPDGAHDSPTTRQLEEALEHLAGQAELREIILSGGDPLTLSDRRLAAIVARAAALPHVERLRVHSRAPVHEPTRVTPALAAALVESASGKPIRLVTHPNHAIEIGPEFRAAVAVLRDAGIPVLSQSVLLRGVNDAATALADLFVASAAAGVEPYYLHHPDRVAGAARFFVSIRRGLDLFAGARRLVPSGVLPAYVIDLPDGSGKIPVESLRSAGGGRWRAPSGLEWDDVDDLAAPASVTG